MNDEEKKLSEIEEGASPEEIEEAIHIRRGIEFRTFVAFLFLFALPEMCISYVMMWLIRIGLIMEGPELSIVISGFSLLAYAAVVFFGSAGIYLRQCSLELYYKTAIPAYLLFAAFSYYICAFWRNGTVWLFMPLRFPKFSGYFGSSNFVSFAVAHVFMLVVIVFAQIYAVWRSE